MGNTTLDQPQEAASLNGAELLPAFVRSSRVTCISGPTGAGKTRLLRRTFRAWREAADITWPVAGLLGQNPAHQTLAASVAEEVAFALQAAGLPQSVISRRVAAALGRVGLAGREDQAVETLSMGETCRLLLASLDALDAPAYFLDEPYAQLDEEGSARLDMLVRHWADAGKAVVFTAQTPHRVSGVALDVHAVNPPKQRQPHPGLADRLEYSHAFDGPVIETRDLSFGYGDRPAVVHSLSLSLSPGQCMLVNGKNGAGKSTLLQGLVGGIAPRAGVLRIFGIEAPTPQALRGKVGIVLQDPDLHLSAASVRNELLQIAADPADADVILEWMALHEYANTPPLRLSHGQRQLVVLGAALVARPALLLLDEPLCGVDAATAAAVLDGLKRIARNTGLTILVVSHAPGAALEGWADVRTILREGRLLHA
jgi:energy-coupling factor transport system ATP-binding protein